MIALCGGGTGGHIYPAIAMAQHWETEPCFFVVSTDRVDIDIVQRYGFETFSIAFSKRKKIVGLWSAFLSARQILRQRHPRALVATGGYFTVPVILAAKSLGIPIFILEQNVLPGRVNRWMAHIATAVYATFEQSRRYFPKHADIMALGNPVRRRFLPEQPQPWMRILDEPEPIMLVIGGSQGAAALNAYVWDRQSEWLMSGWRVIVLMGQSAYQKIDPDHRPFQVLNDSSGRPGIVALPYFEAMDQLYSRVTAVLARAGATTLAELRQFNVPAILVPFPFAKDNHQQFNAEVAESEGGVKWIAESKLFGLPVSALMAMLSPMPTYPSHTVPNTVATQIIANIEQRLGMTSHAV